jgi:FixJ family two-component response regulator
VQHILAAHGLHVLEFQTGGAYLAQHPPGPSACLILDVALEDMSGFELQQRLGGASAPVIFVTRHAEIAASVRAIKAGALDYLTLPFTPELLVRAVCAAIDLDTSTRAQRERAKELRERYQRLTPRERQVLPLVASGLLNKQVASTLGISEVTVEIHRGRIMQKMGAGSFADLVRMADRLAEHEGIGENRPRGEFTWILPAASGQHSLRVDRSVLARARVGYGLR